MKNLETLGISGKGPAEARMWEETVENTRQYASNSELSIFHMSSEKSQKGLQGFRECGNSIVKVLSLLPSIIAKLQVDVDKLYLEKDNLLSSDPKKKSLRDAEIVRSISNKKHQITVMSHYVKLTVEDIAKMDMLPPEQFMRTMWPVFSKSLQNEEFSEEERRQIIEIMELYCDPQEIHREMEVTLELDEYSRENLENKEAALSEDNANLIGDEIRRLLKKHEDKGIIEREHTDVIEKSFEQYINLLVDVAQQDSNPEITIGDALNMITEIVNKLVYQVVESERRSLGDHGIRHIQGNINEAFKMVDVFNEAQTVESNKLTNRDRIKLMTIHYVHDMGYVVGINREGFESTGDHKYFSQVIFDSEHEMFGKIFSDSELKQMSLAIKTHDESTLNFEREPLESIVRLSDNLSLFYDVKLPEVIYRNGNNVKILQKIHLAIENKLPFEQLKQVLVDEINSDMFIPEFNKKQLLQAVNEIVDSAPQFNLGMLAGKLSGYEYDNGGFVIKLRQSDIHVHIKDIFKLHDKQFHKLLTTYGYNKKDIEELFEQQENVARRMDVGGTGNRTYEFKFPPDSDRPILRFLIESDDENHNDTWDDFLENPVKEINAEWHAICSIKEIAEELKKTTQQQKNIEKILNKIFNTKVVYANGIEEVKIEIISAEQYDLIKSIIGLRLHDNLSEQERLQQSLEVAGIYEQIVNNFFNV